MLVGACVKGLLYYPTTQTVTQGTKIIRRTTQRLAIKKGISPLVTSSTLRPEILDIPNRLTATGGVQQPREFQDAEYDTKMDDIDVKLLCYRPQERNQENSNGRAIHKHAEDHQQHKAEQ